MSGIQFELPDDALAEIEERITAKVLAAVPQRAWPEWLSDRLAAEYASCSVSTVKSWRKQGLAYSIVGGLIRIRRADLDVWLEAHPKGGRREAD